MKRDVIEILAYDQELETIFAKGVNGSIALDIIPAAIQHLKGNPEYKQMYLQDTTGAEFVIPQGCAIEQAVQYWQASRNRSEDIKTSAPIPDNISPDKYMFL